MNRNDSFIRNKLRQKYYWALAAAGEAGDTVGEEKQSSVQWKCDETTDKFLFQWTISIQFLGSAAANILYVLLSAFKKIRKNEEQDIFQYSW